METKDLFGTIRPTCKACSRHAGKFCSVKEECMATIKEKENLVIREQAKQIIGKLLYRNKVVDTLDHEQNLITIDGVVMLEHGHVCPIYLDREFYLRPMSLGTEGTVYLSTWYIDKNFKFNGREILDQEVVDRYNETANRYLDSGVIKRVMLFMDN